MVDFPDSVFAAQSVIVTGPPLSGKYRLFHRLLGASGELPIVIATGKSAEDIRADHARIAGAGEKAIVVDCITAGRRDDPTDTATTKYVTAPGNLTQIGVKVTEAIEVAKGEGGDIVVGLFSLSQLLIHAGLESTYQFLHILSQQTAADDIQLIVCLNEPAHDEQTLNTIYERFDCILETRAVDEGNEYRVRTMLESPSPWTPL